MIYKTIIVESNDQDLEELETSLRRYASSHSDIFELTIIKNGEEFIDSYKDRYDIIFISIELSGSNGLTITKRLRKIDKRTPIIFITKYDKFALEAFDVGANDYILKPINYYNFEKKVDRIIEKLPINDENYIIIKTKEGKKIIRKDNIKYVEIMSHDIMIYVNDGVINSSGVLNRFKESLNSSYFSRCSACNLVNLLYIDEIKGNEIKLITGEKLHIGRTRKKEFLKDLALLPKNLKLIAL